jgi:hypothetical protein
VVVKERSVSVILLSGGQGKRMGVLHLFSFELVFRFQVIHQFGDSNLGTIRPL